MKLVSSNKNEVPFQTLSTIYILFFYLFKHMPTILVSEAIATAIFTITRILYNSIFNVIALILFSKLPGGSSARFWYEQPDIVSKITSLFDPYGPTTLLSKLSPITVIENAGPINATKIVTARIFA